MSFDRTPEVLPPEDQEEINPIYEAARKRAEQNPESKSSRAIAWLLDECIRIPGTNLRIGLDPIIGLIPGGGETVATIIGAFVLGDAGKKGVPFKSLIKMGANMVVNAGFGAIPAIGDVFSMWFKSNTRNYQMLREYLESDDGKESRGGWWPVMLIAGIIGTVLVINIAAFSLYIFLFSWLAKEFAAIGD